MKACLRAAAVFLLLIVSGGTAHAGIVTISTGVVTNVPNILNGIVDLLLGWSALVATALFLVGCLLMVGSGGNDATLSNGKKIMKASLIGLAIVLASWLILSTAVFFIAG